MDVNYQPVDKSSGTHVAGVERQAVVLDSGHQEACESNVGRQWYGIRGMQVAGFERCTAVKGSGYQRGSKRKLNGR